MCEGGPRVEWIGGSMGESALSTGAGIATTRVVVVESNHNSQALSVAADLLSSAGFAVERRESLPPDEEATFDLILRDADRSVGAVSSTDVHIGRLLIDGVRKQVLVDGDRVLMSAREYVLLRHLASHPDVVFSRPELLRAVWGSTWRTEGSVTEYVRRLRVLLEPTGIGECIVTRKGFGYSFDAEAAMRPAG